MQSSGKIKLADLNSLLTCILCGGYYIDATTIIECLHSFCRTCIVKYLHTNKYCPTCDVQVHKTKPLDNISWQQQTAVNHICWGASLLSRSDQTLQDIVYKLVPGLFKNEMKRRRDFYQKHEAGNFKGEVPMSSEKRGDVLGGERLIFTPEDVISISLEYCPPCLPFPSALPQNNEDSSNLLQCDMLPKAMCHRRYLRCPGAIKVAHLKKFLQAKYDLLPSHNIDVMYVHDYLRDEYTLIDLAYIYSWRRNAPLRLFYKIELISKKLSKTKDSVFAKEVPSYRASEEAVSPHVKMILNPANSSPAPSVAAAPSSQVYLQSHPSPPPSPQMATEPDRLGSSKHNCAALPNGQVKIGSAEMSNKLLKNSDIQCEKKSAFFDKSKDNAISINSGLHLTDRHRRRDVKLVSRNKSFPDCALDRMNGKCRDRRGSLSKRFPHRKLS